MWMLLGFVLLAEPQLTVDAVERSVQFEGTLWPSHFNREGGLAQHHLIVWREGRAGWLALIQAHVSDRAVQDALEGLSAVPGNNVTTAAWLRREDLSATDPDVSVEGTRLEITVTWPGQTPVGVERLLEDLGQRGFLWRFGGHKALIPLWRSGCVVCLESCPGGRISNARYTMRHLADGSAKFRVKPLPPDGTQVRIKIRILPD